VYFFSAAGSLFPQDDNPAYDIFDFDRFTAKLSRLTYNQAGREALEDSFEPVASADGRFVAFGSYAWNLVPGEGNGNSDIFLIDRGAAIPDLSIYATGETNLKGLGLHGLNIMQRRELALTNNLARFFIRLDNDGPTNETFSLHANLSPAGWSGQFFRVTTNISAAVTTSGYAISLPAGSNFVCRLDVSSLGAAIGEAWAEWVIAASGTSSNAAMDAVRAVATRLPSPPALQVVSRAADGHLGNDASEPAELSADGRFVTFTSTSSDLTNRDYNFAEDVFVLDRQSRALECISRQANGTNGNGRSYSSRISRDGRYVVFQSGATNLIIGDTNDREDVFLFDRQARTTTVISTGPGGVRSTRDSGYASLSGDGRYVAFESLADNFVANDTNGTWDIFLRDVTGGTIQCLSLAGGQTANDESHGAVISTDGSLVVFSSLASDLVAADTNNTFDLFLWQRGVQGVRLLSRTSEGRAGNDISQGASISDDNRWILFASKATDLAVPRYDSNSVTFLYDRLSDQLSQIVPPNLTGRQRGGFYGARLAPDGRLMTMLADVTDGPGSSNYVMGVFLYDRLNGDLTELTRNRDGSPAKDHSLGARVSADSRWVVFSSRAGNLLGEINPGTDQLMLYDRASFQPDEWIRRGSNAPYRGQNLFGGSGQRVEMTIPFNATNVFFVTIRNYGNVSDQFIFRAPTNITGGIKARYFLQSTGTEISGTATNAGWVSGVLAAGDSREVRVQITANNTNLFNQDLVFTSTSLSDPTKVDVVSLRLLRDDDNDGLPNTWEQQYFLNPTNAVASADPDGDGFSNYQEYVAGTNPTNRNSNLRITSVEPGPGWGVRITWPSATNRFYTVERALADPAAFNRVVDFFGQGATSSYLDTWPTNPPPSFYRIRAELP